MAILIGQKNAKCPVCGGDRFIEVGVGPLKYTIQGEHVDLKFKATGVGYLCASSGTPCALRPFTVGDMKDTEAARGNGDAVIQP